MQRKIKVIVVHDNIEYDHDILTECDRFEC